MTKENNIDDYQIQTINLYINIIIYINIIKRHRLAGWADGVYREFSIITRTDFNGESSQKHHTGSFRFTFCSFVLVRLLCLYTCSSRR